MPVRGEDGGSRIGCTLCSALPYVCPLQSHTYPFTPSLSYKPASKSEYENPHRRRGTTSSFSTWPNFLTIPNYTQLFPMYNNRLLSILPDFSKRPIPKLPSTCTYSYLIVSCTKHSQKKIIRNQDFKVSHPYFCPTLF